MPKQRELAHVQHLQLALRGGFTRHSGFPSARATNSTPASGRFRSTWMPLISEPLVRNDTGRSTRRAIRSSCSTCPDCGPSPTARRA